MGNLTINQLLDKIYMRYDSMEIKDNPELLEVHKKLKLAKTKEDGNVLVDNTADIVRRFGL